MSKHLMNIHIYIYINTLYVWTVSRAGNKIILQAEKKTPHQSQVLAASPAWENHLTVLSVIHSKVTSKTTGEVLQNRKQNTTRQMRFADLPRGHSKVFDGRTHVELISIIYLGLTEQHFPTLELCFASMKSWKLSLSSKYMKVYDTGW